MKKLTIAFVFAVAASLGIAAQIKPAVLVQIVKAEDARRYDAVLENLMKSPDAKIRARAALAAGRIGKEAAVPALADLVQKDIDENVRLTAVFALGETELPAASNAVLAILANTKETGPLRARAVEAAGKIAAANAKDETAKTLGDAIVWALKFEAGRRSAPDEQTILLGLTAALRARPAGAAEVVAEFLDYSIARIRADAGNTLTRLRGKVALDLLRKMVAADSDPIARANAARALGAAEDKDSLAALLKAATDDADSRVRVAAIRSLVQLKDASVAEKLIKRGEVLFASVKQGPGAPRAVPSELNEILEIVTALGRFRAGSDDVASLNFLNSIRQLSGYAAPETEIALARIAPQMYLQLVVQLGEGIFDEDWRTGSAIFQALGEIASAPDTDKNKITKSAVRVFLVQMIGQWLNERPNAKRFATAKMAVPAMLGAFAAFKSENTGGIMRPILEMESDIYIRATVAGILGDLPPSKENTDVLDAAFRKSLLMDKSANDATLALMDALFKANKSDATGSIFLALSSPDFLVRKKALALLSDKSLYADKPGLPTMLEAAMKRKSDELSTFSLGSKLGVLTNTDADYLRAVSRRNGSVKAVVKTAKGSFTIDFTPEDAPLTVDNFIKLARSGYFNGLTVHRVVPNFVMQDGDPRGDGEGGPGWEIRCEVNMLPYDRGAVGMALSGKDTGGSQWFVTHSPQPHLDGGYTVFGNVTSGMETVDNIARGDKIVSITIVEAKASVVRRRR